MEPQDWRQLTLPVLAVGLAYPPRAITLSAVTKSVWHTALAFAYFAFLRGIEASPAVRSFI